MIKKKWKSLKTYTLHSDTHTHADKFANDMKSTTNATNKRTLPIKENSTGILQFWTAEEGEVKHKDKDKEKVQIELIFN